MSNDDKKVIRTGRRRPTGTSRSGERDRAEAPRRQRESTPSRQVSGGSSGRPPGQNRPPVNLPSFNLGRSGCILLAVGLGVVILLFICFGSQLFSGILSNLPEQDFEMVSDESPITSTDDVPTTRPTINTGFTPPPSSSEGDTWLVMLYMDADDKVLEQDIFLDLNEAERIGSSENVHIVAQLDRFQGGFSGDGNWVTTKRFYITQDDDLGAIHSPEVSDLNEVNMGDGETLVDFVTWAVSTFPADKHALILSDHGLGWPGGWSDPSPATGPESGSPIAERLGNHLYLDELDRALEEIRAQMQLDRFELIGLDACLMGHLEVFEALRPHTRFAVASQETEPALGWAYTGFLTSLTANPNMSGDDLGNLIVQSYIVEDQRIVDDQARAEFTNRRSLLGSLFGPVVSPSAEQITQQLSGNITLTAVDLDALDVLMVSMNQMAFSLQDVSAKTVAEARTYAQSFTSIFGSDVPPSYIDIGNFVQILSRSGEIDLEITDQVLIALDQAVLAEKHGKNIPGATGISIYFPNSQLYKNAVAGAESYTTVAERFAANSLWDDYLAYYYAGRPFDLADQELIVPDRTQEITPPDTGEINVSLLELSDVETAPGSSVLIRADISGENIGYIKLFVGYFDQLSNSIFIADSDYLESPETYSIGDLYYPNWGGGEEFTLEFEWEPIVFAVFDGTDAVPALFTPEQYGADPEDAVYTVDGIYQDADDGSTRFARLYFSNSTLQQVYGYTGEENDGTGAPWEIVPQPGDSFTILEKWLDLDAQGNVSQTATQEGGTVYFSDTPLTWEVMDAAAGEYIIGIIVEDLDGNQIPVYESIIVN